MKVSELMSPDVCAVGPEQMIQDAARMMLDRDTGAVLVGSPESPQGIVTDRDITVRAVAQGLGPDTPVGQVLSGDLVTVRADQDVEVAALIMSDRQVRRVAVVDAGGRVTGMISVGDLATSRNSDPAAAALSGIAQPGGEHQQETADAQ